MNPFANVPLIRPGVAFLRALLRTGLSGARMTYNAGVLRRHWKTLVAVLGGNFLYFGVLYSYLPPEAQHRRNELDWGLVLDFWICLAIYGLMAFPFRRKP